MKSKYKEYVKSFTIALILAILIKIFIFSAVLVVGKSMEDTLHSGERCIVLRYPYIYNSLQREDIIILKAAEKVSKDFYVKRIIALPGDTIEIKNSKIILNNVEISEHYLSEKSKLFPCDDIFVKVGDDEVYVLGDNRNSSVDSRFFGPIKTSSIKGKVVFRYFPFTKLKSF